MSSASPSATCARISPVAGLRVHRNNRAHPATQQDQTSQLWASAMLESVQKLGVPVQPVPNG
jgi:hypothetical protein